ncbi:MAG: hypothetical protein GX595_10885 [Lentisphaerae bacterium]|nr:hypothetical protein [Lentisphaerota bacterium]
MMKPLVLWCGLSVAALLGAQETPLLLNPGFEDLVTAQVDPAGQYQGWTLGTPPEVPREWKLNNAYPGSLECRRDGSHDGAVHVRLNGTGRQPAHLYQICAGLQPERWYRVTAWVRGGPLTLSFYEYFTDRGIGGSTVAQVTGASPSWRLVTGFYRTPGAGYRHSALALSVPPGQSAEVDTVAIEPLPAAEVSPDAPDVLVEGAEVALRLSATGSLRELRCPGLEDDLGPGETPWRFLTVARAGVPLTVHRLERDGDRLRATFLDPEVEVVLRVTPHRRHLFFEVVEARPADLESFSVEFPVRRRQTVGPAFNATYDDTAGVCFLGTTENTFQRSLAQGDSVQRLSVNGEVRHGLVGAGMALVAAPRKAFHEAIMTAEREHGLPCPMLEGQWARFSEPVRRSYLFMVDASEAGIDRIIEVARIGGFGTIIFLKDNWLANHGHFDINRRNFPEGLPSLQRAVAKIHAAGFGAGVHVFGPSISPNDPYVTPRPDDRLAYLEVAPLAEPVDARATTLVLSAPPELPPRTKPTGPSPTPFLRLGDEIIRVGEVSTTAPWRVEGCQRGALGTAAAAHPAGERVRAMLAVWGFFMVNPDSSLADEVATRFADVINACDFDMVYVDASDGMADQPAARWYYLNTMHLKIYRKFRKDILYQTSTGTGTNLLWHLVPRSASADGHGDLKGYLDQRLPAMLGMAANFTRPDVGWYYLFKEVRPDQIEYVCAKTIGLDASLSIETSLAALDSHPQGRQMLEMVARYEHCRRQRVFPEALRASLLEPQRDVKLVPDGQGGWSLWRAAYEEPRFVDVLDGRQNVWTITNDQAEPCRLGVEVVRGANEAPAADYDAAGGVTLETFEDRAPYLASAENTYETFVVGADRVLTPDGVVRRGLTQRFAISTEGARVGAACAVMTAENSGGPEAWSGIGRRFSPPLDLSAQRALALWIHGDGKGEIVRVQCRDTQGRHADWRPAMTYKGWRLHVFPMADATDFDWKQVAFLLLYFNSVPAQASVEVRFDDLRALPALLPLTPLRQPSLAIGTTTLTYDVTLQPRQGLTDEGPGGVRFWPGSMAPSIPVATLGEALELPPGTSTITLSSAPGEPFPIGTQVLLYRLWPLRP